MSGLKQLSVFTFLDSDYFCLESLCKLCQPGKYLLICQESAHLAYFIGHDLEGTTWGPGSAPGNRRYAMIVENLVLLLKGSHHTA